MTMINQYNFGAGPAMLPSAILQEAQVALLNWQDTGLSILEIGHRTPEFMQFITETENSWRDLLAIPNNYRVLFLGGAARTQFAMIPMNLLHKGDRAGYCVSGLWSSLAYTEAMKLNTAYSVVQSKEPFMEAPTASELHYLSDTAYVYYTPNETVNGVQFDYIPDTKGIPLIADMTSCLLSEPININDFGLIFAGSQKNIGPAGMTIVIVRDDLLARSPEEPLATMFDYRTHSRENSLYATPPVFNCYMAARMFKWIQAEGGLAVMQQRNRLKAATLYQYIDNSEFYQCLVTPRSRSVMNVCFSIKNEKLHSVFLERAQQRGLYSLKGHRAVGGLRASLYNAMPLSGVEALLEFMRDFALDHRL